MSDVDRGCVFLNFGSGYALRLLVSVASLRRVYCGPITTFLSRDAAGVALERQLAELGSGVTFVDVNVGVMGISRPRGDAFLHDWAEGMEKARSADIPLLDEMLALALLPKHRHVLADEKWNCPADEFFRRTNLADACVIHYFADGWRVRGIRVGRSPTTWAGQKWYRAYAGMKGSLNLAAWERSDPTFTGPLRRAVVRTASLPLSQSIKRVLLRTRHSLRQRGDRLARLLLRRCWFPLQQLTLDALFTGKYRVPVHVTERATVIILSYQRMGNIRRIVRSALQCAFVDRVIVCNNNPDVDLRPYVPECDPRLEVLQQNTHRGPSYRYELARDYPSQYYICIDDDVFPTPWQLRRLFAALLREPESPVGSAGEMWNSSTGRTRMIPRSLWSWRDQSRPVDIVIQMHAFTREHLEQYFRLLEKMDLENSGVHSSEDVIMSFAGRTRPRLQDVGHVFECATAYDARVATHGRDGFFAFRYQLFARLADAQTLDTRVKYS